VADRIMVLVGGKVAEEGTHQALLSRRGEYFKLYQMQFSNDPEKNPSLSERETPVAVTSH